MRLIWLRSLLAFHMSGKIVIVWIKIIMEIIVKIGIKI